MKHADFQGQSNKFNKNVQIHVIIEKFYQEYLQSKVSLEKIMKSNGCRRHKEQTIYGLYPYLSTWSTLCTSLNELNIKWNESGFRPPLCTYRLNWARRTSWGWRDDWDDTVLQTQDSKFEPWRSEAEHATSRSRRLPTILTFTRGWGRNNFVSFKPPRPGTEPRTLAWKAAVLTTTLGPRDLT